MTEIRDANTDDWEGIGKVLLESYNIESLDEAKNAFLDELKKGHHYIVSINETDIIGIISWVVHGLPKHGLAELDRIAVLPEFRGKCISRRLFNFMLERIKTYYREHESNLRKLYVLTHEDNMRARTFYEKMGFGLEAILKNHYYNNRNECVMSMFFDRSEDLHED